MFRYQDISALSIKGNSVVFIGRNSNSSNLRHSRRFSTLEVPTQWKRSASWAPERSQLLKHVCQFSWQAELVSCFQTALAIWRYFCYFVSLALELTTASTACNSSPWGRKCTARPFLPSSSSSSFVWSDLCRSPRHSSCAAVQLETTCSLRQMEAAPVKPPQWWKVHAGVDCVFNFCCYKCLHSIGSVYRFLKHVDLEQIYGFANQSDYVCWTAFIGPFFGIGRVKFSLFYHSCLFLLNTV